MVSLWPWKNDDSSPASFEKTLSTLSGKITRRTTNLDSLRQRSRRLKALWTLYASFAYLLYSIILVLLIGWRKWGAVEFTAVAGGPVVIYLVRLGLTTYYSYRTSTVQGHLDGLQKQRDATIEKLKTATKYNTTQQLLEKYGGTPSKAKSPGSLNKTPTSNKARDNTSRGDRTGFAPPPTANIVRGNVGTSLPSTPLRTTPMSSPLGQNPPFSASATSAAWRQPSTPADETADFAPNAFPSAPQYVHMGERLRWYDRFMDLLLGEDETLPKNRLALICQRCRLVNGQAPPGIKRLEDLGKWRCSECSAMNGEESEAKKIIAEMQGPRGSNPKMTSSQAGTVPTIETDNPDEDILVGSNDDHESDITQYSEDELDASSSRKTEEGSTRDPEPTLGLGSIPDSKHTKSKMGRPKGSANKKK